MVFFVITSAKLHPTPRDCPLFWSLLLVASRGPHAKGAEVVGAQGACLEGAEGLTQRCGGAEGAGVSCLEGARGLTQRAQRWWVRRGLVWRAQRGAALAHGTEAFQPPPRAADGNFFECFADSAYSRAGSYHRLVTRTECAIYGALPRGGKLSSAARAEEARKPPFHGSAK